MNGLSEDETEDLNIKYDHAAIERDIAFGAKMLTELYRKAGDDWNRWFGAIVGLRGLHYLACEKCGTTNKRSQVYRDAMTELLKLRKHFVFAQMNRQDRSDCYQLMDHIEEIDEWYKSLERDEKMRWKHPNTIIKHCPKELLARGLKGHNKPPKKGAKKKGNPEADVLRAILVEVIREFVMPVNPKRADELLAKLYAFQTDPNDDIGDMGIDGLGDDEEEAA